MNIPDNMTLQATVEQGGAKSGADTEVWSERFAHVARVLILLVLVAAPWMIGSVSYWAQFWLSAGLLLAIAVWWFDTALNKRNSQVLPYVGLFVGLGILIGLCQLIPLSGGLADFFLGRQVELYEQFSLPELQEDSVETAKRVTIDSAGTWHQIRLLVLALSGLLLGCRYFRSPRHLTLLLTAMTLNGTAIAIFGTIQKLASDGKSLFWTIKLQLGGTPFGPFVNRNNAAGYLLICLACAVGLTYILLCEKKNRGPVPIISTEIPFWRQVSQQLLYFISELTAPKLASLLAAVFIAMGIVASLSRGAVLGLLTATILTVVTYGIIKRPKNMGLLLMPLVLAVVMLTAWLGFSDRLVERFDKLDSAQEVTKWDGRLQTWTDTWPSVAEMGKIGSGLGTYATVSRLYRTDQEINVFKHAENQYYQALVEAGWGGLLIYLAAWGLYYYYAYFLLSRGQSPATVGAGLAGIFLFWAQAVASFLDFGLYIPANMIAMSCVVGTIAYYAHSMAYRLKQQTVLRFQFSNSLVQVLLVVIFAACTAVSLDINRKSKIEALHSPRTLNHDTFTIDEVEERINRLTELANRSVSRAAASELGQLYVHRARLELFELFKNEVLAVEDEQEFNQKIWDATSLIRLHERSELLRKQTKLSQKNFLKLPAIQVQLPAAIHWFQASVRLSPMQPEIQVVLGELHALLHGIEEAKGYLERGIKISPSNSLLLKQVSVLYLQAGEFKSAAPHMRRYLQLVPKDFDLLMQITKSQMLDFDDAIDHDLMVSEIMPEDANLLYRYATELAVKDSLIQKTALQRAEQILLEDSQSDPRVNLLQGKVKLAIGDIDTAVDYLRSYLVNRPNDQETREILIGAYSQLDRYDAALEEAQRLLDSDGKKVRYRRIYENLKSIVDEL